MPELLTSILLFGGLHFLLFSTANTLIWRFFADEMRDVFDWLLLFLVLITAQVLAVLGVIGFLGELNLQAMVGGTVVCYLAGGVAFPFLGKRFQLGTFAAWKKFRQLLFKHHHKDGIDWIWAIFGFLILYGAVELFNAFLFPPWEYDTIAYHMPIVVEWLQSESLWEIFYAVWGGPLGYYPSHHELLHMWFILPFGNDLLVNTINFGLIAAMIVVIYKILKEMGVQDFLAWLAGALVMVMPIFLRQVGTGQVDVMMALGIVLTWYYLLRTFRRHDGLLFIPAVLNLALVLGTKYLAIIYVIPTIVVFLFLWQSWSKTHKWWWVWFLVIMGTLGSMWYWRNLIMTGNPIFPAEVSIGNFVLFEGYTGLTERIQQLSLWARVSESGELGEWLAAMVKETGWHMYLVIVAYVLLVMEAFYKLFFSKMQRGEGKFYTLLLFFLPAYWYLYFIAPYTASMMEHNVRYAMPWLVLSMIMVVYVVFKLGHIRRIFVMALMGVLWWQFLILVPAQRIGNQPFLELEYVTAYPWLFALLFVVLGLIGFWFEGWRRQRKWHVLVLLSVFVSSFFFLYSVQGVRADIRHQVWQKQYAFPLMKAHEWLDENVPADAVIANSLNPLYYPLYGPNLQRRVRYVNINACGECDYGSYEQAGLTVRQEASYSDWVENLASYEAEYVVLGYSIRNGLEDIIPHELGWAENNPEVFEEVFREGDVVIYHTHFSL